MDFYSSIPQEESEEQPDNPGEVDFTKILVRLEQRQDGQARQISRLRLEVRRLEDKIQQEKPPQQEQSNTTPDYVANLESRLQAQSKQIGRLDLKQANAEGVRRGFFAAD